MIGDSGEETAQLGYTAFVVNESARCMWSDSLRERNREFLEGLDPGYFKYVAALYEREIQGEHKSASSLALRLAYGQALETLFALLGAAIQAPHCPLGWILSYENRELYDFVKSLSAGRRVLAAGFQPLSWADVSREIHLFEPTPPKAAADVQREFGEVWALLAHDFADKSASEEYNSIKHGFRARQGGFNLTLKPIGHDAPPALESKSEFGTKSFALKWLDKANGNFCVLDSWRNWDPKSLVVRLELIAASIVNVRSYLLLHHGLSAPSARFEWVADPEKIQLAWQTDSLISSLRGGVVIESTDITPVTKDRILALYESAEAPPEP